MPARVCGTLLRRAWERGRRRNWYENSARGSIFIVDGVAASQPPDGWRMARNTLAICIFANRIGTLALPGEESARTVLEMSAGVRGPAGISLS